MEVVVPDPEDRTNCLGLGAPDLDSKSIGTSFLVQRDADVVSVEILLSREAGERFTQFMAAHPEERAVVVIGGTIDVFGFADNPDGVTSFGTDELPPAAAIEVVRALKGDTTPKRLREPTGNP